VVILFYIYTLKKAPMNHLFGVHDQKVDIKGRVLFPSALKRQLLAEVQDGFVLKRSIFEKCLELYPMMEWQKEMKGVNKLNRFVRKNNDFIRMFMAGVRIVELDDAGRILIPKDLIQWAGIDRDVVLASSINRIEIWDKALYEASLEENASEFGDLAEDVMGDINPGDE
jgi:MraZ protein